MSPGAFGGYYDDQEAVTQAFGCGFLAIRAVLDKMRRSSPSIGQPKLALFECISIGAAWMRQIRAIWRSATGPIRPSEASSMDLSRL